MSLGGLIMPTEAKVENLENKQSTQCDNSENAAREASTGKCDLVNQQKAQTEYLKEGGSSGITGTFDKPSFFDSAADKVQTFFGADEEEVVAYKNGRGDGGAVPTGEVQPVGDADAVPTGEVQPVGDADAKPTGEPQDDTNGRKAQGKDAADGKDDPEAKFGQPKPAETEVENTTPVKTYTNDDGTVVNEYEDGTMQATHPDGTQVKVKPDGSHEAVFPDGSSERVNADGTYFRQKADGSWSEKQADGTEVMYDKGMDLKITTTPDGTQINEYRNGDKIIDYPDGSSTRYNHDGTRVYEGSNGVKVTVKPNGDSLTELTDGTMVTTTQDGTITTMSPDGSYTELHRDGSMKIRHKDGTMTEVTADEHIISKDKNGRVIKDQGPDFER